MFHRLSLIVALALSLMLGARHAVAAEKEMVDNPTYLHWKAFNLNSWAKLKQTIEAEGQKLEMTATMKLVEKTAEQVTVEAQVTMTVEGQTMTLPAQRMTYKAKVAKEDVTPDDATKVETKTGTETLEVAGKKIKCAWSDGVIKNEQGLFKGKSWTAETVPGNIVKMDGQVESKTGETGKIKMELLDYEAAK